MFYDPVVTKIIRVAFIYPGLGLSLSECKQFRKSRGGVMNMVFFTTVTHVGGDPWPSSAVPQVSAPAVTPPTTDNIAYASETLKLNNSCKRTYGITGSRNGLGATQCSISQGLEGLNALPHLADLPTSGQNSTPGVDFQPPPKFS